MGHKSWGEKEVANFRQRRLCAQKFNLAHKFRQNFSVKFCILEPNFPTRKKLSDKLKFWGVAPPAPCYDAIVGWRRVK